MTIETAEWNQILIACGVLPEDAMRWAPVFYRHVQVDRFSAGARELDDFLGQVLAETGALHSISEKLGYTAARIRQLANYSPPGSRWRSLGARADELAGKPEKMAEAAYGGRMGNGPEGSGDGWKYRGGGIPMVTGKDNYALLQKLTGLPLLAHPDLLRDPETAMQCGLLWWEKKVPDGALDSLERVTRAVNGGQIGLEDRRRFTDRASAALAPFLAGGA